MTIYVKEIYREATVFMKDGFTYVPHYEKPGIWVGPGYKQGHNESEYTEDYLLAVGAVPREAMLWPRMTVRAKELA